ncbi:hypothetical protein WME94_30880 [Sorangium sp. So ce429]
MTSTAEHHRELGRAFTHSLAGWIALFALEWVRHWTNPAAGTTPPAPWVAAALLAASIAVYARNLALIRARPGFAALRTVAHLLFGMGTPAALLLTCLLGAPHGMSALPTLGLPFLALWAAAILGYVLIRFVIAPIRSTRTAASRPHAGA